MHTLAQASLLMVEDHPMLRESLIDYLRTQFPMLELREASGLEEACQAIRTSSPDLILLDLNLRDASGFTALTVLRSACPNAGIVVVSGVVDEGMELHLRELGADAFVSKSGRRDVLLSTLRPLLLRCELARTPTTRSTSSPSLTPQQLVVLAQLLEGHSNKEIARRTGLSNGTVRNYVSEVFIAFAVHSRSQLLAMFRS
ncbi:response regulator [Hydrogenophaga luteola]|uniref:Response regulator n=1 Tax=Hydrogenophaga luteola TaxID=1591122 RepID=A0ABV7W171_9BURK